MILSRLAIHRNVTFLLNPEIIHSNSTSFQRSTLTIQFHHHILSNTVHPLTTFYTHWDFLLPPTPQPHTPDLFPIGGVSFLRTNLIPHFLQDLLSLPTLIPASSFSSFFFFIRMFIVERGNSINVLHFYHVSKQTLGNQHILIGKSYFFFLWNPLDICPGNREECER